MLASEKNQRSANHCESGNKAPEIKYRVMSTERVSSKAIIAVPTIELRVLKVEVEQLISLRVKNWNATMRWAVVGPNCSSDLSQFRKFDWFCFWMGQILRVP